MQAEYDHVVLLVIIYPIQEPDKPINYLIIFFLQHNNPLKQDRIRVLMLAY